MFEAFDWPRYAFNVLKWWAHLASNQGPSGYEPVALPTELWAPKKTNIFNLKTDVNPEEFHRPLPYSTKDFNRLLLLG